MPTQAATACTSQVRHAGMYLLLLNISNSNKKPRSSGACGWFGDTGNPASRLLSCGHQGGGMDNVQWFMTFVGCCVGAITVLLYLVLKTFDQILKEVKETREAAQETAYYTKYPSRRPADDDDDPAFPKN